MDVGGDADRGSGGAPVSPAKVIVSGHRAKVPAGAATTQWYVNDVKGIEGGFTLAKLPPLRPPPGRERQSRSNWRCPAT